ncbi:MAG TPA: threonine--tRNA ligase, partial [Acidobacteria bacterium]|nr:threonine--tRNA ligase [Acidobacteriota bacterium]
KTELNANRPMYYEGVGNSSGHAFICDGYDNNDLFHFNWGWGGAYDGYFLVNNLNPGGTGTGGGSGSFNSNQKIVKGIQPPQSAQTYNMNLYDNVTLSSTSINYGQAFDVSTNIHNNGSNNFSGDYCAAILDNNNSFIDYVEIKTPIVYNKALWETSGHWEHYRENMFLVESSDSQPMGVKAMNCPGHMLVFASEVRSYRDLPLRFHEQTPLHRNEASGVLAGLIRVRQFAQDDAHCFVTEDQIGEEVARLLRLVERVYGDFDLTPVLRLSTRPAEFLGERAQWDHAEAQLKEALADVGLPYTVDEGDGAFYGPKVDVDVTDAIGRRWQCATIQLDYQLPRRFDLKYIGADNAEHCPVVIHRAILGSFERFVALLIEHYAGALPMWLAPVQAIVLPIADRHTEYAETVRTQLIEAGLRVEIDARQEKIGYKIREAQLQKIPYMLIAGDREISDGTVAVRSRAGGDQGSRPLDEFRDAAVNEVRHRKGAATRN